MAVYFVDICLGTRLIITKINYRLESIGPIIYTNPLCHRQFEVASGGYCTEHVTR